MIQRSGNAFTQVAVDQAIERTVNRDTNSKEGIVGFRLNRGAVQRWLLTSKERAVITLVCREVAGMCVRDCTIKEKGKRGCLLMKKMCGKSQQL